MSVSAHLNPPICLARNMNLRPYQEIAADGGEKQMNLRDAAQQALDALERYQVKRQDFDRFADVIIVLRAALDEQEQAEPVAPVYSATPFCPTCESLARAVMTDQVLYDAIVKNELLRDDAARWRWARKRLETRMLETMRGKLKLALNVRVGWSFFETTGDPGRGYIRREQYEQECCYLDEQVDEAIKRANARRLVQIQPAK